MTHHPLHIPTLQKYYDVTTLQAWIARYEDTPGKRQQAQVARWRRVLATLEKVEPSTLPLGNDYVK